MKTGRPRFFSRFVTGTIRSFAPLAFVSLGLLAGCQSLDKTLSTADRTLSAVSTPTMRSVAGVAGSRKPNEALRQAVQSRAELYERNPQALIADIRTIKNDYEKLMSLLGGNVDKAWGHKEVKLPTRTKYIKYTQNYKSRAIVEFDTGEITVETLDEKDPKGSLKNAVTTSLLTPDDPRAVDLFTDKSIPLTSDKQPYLLGLVVDQNNQPVATPAQADAFAEYLIEKRSGTRPVDLPDGRKSAHYVTFSMVPNFENKKAEKYRTVVGKYASQYKISPSLVFAIIRTESNFNPFAVSSAPAYGLMQLVPSSGGREANRHAKGKDEMPTRDYLFDAENNIELGTAYLNVLFYRYLDYIANSISREYCMISAYNTGPGNVLRAFSKDKVAAANAINSLEPPAVYEQLRTNLPYEETRQYLLRVVNFRRQFISPGS
jgi:membrane-bound lytic murein transglycosylase C